MQLPEERRVALRTKLEKQLSTLVKAETAARGRLDNRNFVEKAPEHVVSSLRQKLSDYESQVERIQNTLTGL